MHTNTQYHYPIILLTVFALCPIASGFFFAFHIFFQQFILIMYAFVFHMFRWFKEIIHIFYYKNSILKFEKMVISKSTELTYNIILKINLILKIVFLITSYKLLSTLLTFYSERNLFSAESMHWLDYLSKSK